VLLRRLLWRHLLQLAIVAHYYSHRSFRGGFLSHVQRKELSFKALLRSNSLPSVFAQRKGGSQYEYGSTKDDGVSG